MVHASSSKGTSSRTANEVVLENDIFCKEILISKEIKKENIKKKYSGTFQSINYNHMSPEISSPNYNKEKFPKKIYSISQRNLANEFEKISNQSVNNYSIPEKTALSHSKQKKIKKIKNPQIKNNLKKKYINIKKSYQEYVKINEKNKENEKAKAKEKEKENKIIIENQCLKLLISFQNIFFSDNKIPEIIDFSNPFLIERSRCQINYKEILGKGGFGEVYTGFYDKIPVAFKIIEISLDQMQIIMSEIVSMLICQNKYLLKLYGCFIEKIKEDFFSIYLVMEKMETDLRKLIFKEKIKLNYQTKIKILIGIAKGIKKLHEIGFVHCDLKMGNILLKFDKEKNIYQTKISDFGLVKNLTKGKTKKTSTFGFSERTSPFEYLVEEKVSSKTDIWSFGILMYELMSENIAWSMLTGPQTVAKVSMKTPFYSINSKIGLKEIDDIIQMCLNYDYEKRPNDIELISELKKLQHH